MKIREDISNEDLIEVIKVVTGVEANSIAVKSTMCKDIVDIDPISVIRSGNNNLQVLFTLFTHFYAIIEVAVVNDNIKFKLYNTDGGKAITVFNLESTLAIIKEKIIDYEV